MALKNQRKMKGSRHLAFWSAANAVVTLILVYVTSMRWVHQDTRLSSKEPGTAEIRASCVEVDCINPGAGTFSRAFLIPTALASFPGSGNTWTRYLLTTATGILTGSVYDKSRDVPVSPSRAKRLLVVKTHQEPEAVSKFSLHRAVLIIRNPYEALLAEFNRRAFQRNETDPDYFKIGIRSPKDFKQKWPLFVSANMGRWLELNTAWASFDKPLHVLVYHRMVNNLEPELRQTLRFLNDSSIIPRIHCALREPEGTVHRKKAEWQEAAAVFDEWQKKFLNEAIVTVQKALEKRTGLDLKDFRTWKR